MRVCEDNTARNNDILDKAAQNSQEMTKEMMEYVRKKRAYNFETKVLNERMPKLLEALQTSERTHKDMLRRLDEQKLEMEQENSFKDNLKVHRGEICQAVEVEMNELMLLKKQAQRKIVADSVQGKITDYEGQAKKWHAVMLRTGIKEPEELFQKMVNR